jgi:predicted SAM-dependent methyltransferase
MKWQKEKEDYKMKQKVDKGIYKKPELEKGQVGINLGCGQIYYEGWINVDIDPAVKHDKEFDLEKLPYPFESNSVDYVVMRHVIEHMEYPYDVVREISRILKPGGTLYMSYPHFTGSVAHLASHKHHGFCRNGFQLGLGFSKRKIRLLYSPFKRFGILNKIVDWFINLWGDYYEKIPLMMAMFPCWEVQYVMVK